MSAESVTARTDGECPGVVVAGLGNEYRRDDGAGPLVAAQVASLGVARDIGPIVDPLDLLGRWDRARLAIVIDAIRSASPPGTVQSVELPTSTGARSATSTHGISLPGVMRLAQTLGVAPERIVVVGIEGLDFGRGKGLSPVVDAAIPVAVRKVMDAIAEVSTCA